MSLTCYMYETITSFIIHIYGCFQLSYRVYYIWDSLKYLYPASFTLHQTLSQSAQPAFYRVRWLFGKKSRKHYEWKDLFWTLPYSLVVRITIARSSHRRCSVKKVVLKIFSNFTRKHYAGVFLIKLQTSGLER